MVVYGLELDRITLNKSNNYQRLHLIDYLTDTTQLPNHLIFRLQR
jgi:hypothetical protein